VKINREIGFQHLKIIKIERQFLKIERKHLNRDLSLEKRRVKNPSIMEIPG